MNNFRLVLLDYAKHQLDKPIVQKTLGDMIMTKQKNYERADPNYVVLDKHDMIGTHVLIYETTNLFEPKLVAAQRLVYENRSQLHKIATPLQDLIPQINDNCKQAYHKFQIRVPLFAEYNSFFIAPEFSTKNCSIKLADISSALSFLHVTRLGINSMVTCTNEKFKTHRLLENIGSFDKGYEFVHPAVPDTHMLILIEKYNIPYIQSVYQAHKSLFDNVLEVTPENETYKSIPQTIQNVFGDLGEYKIAG